MCESTIMNSDFCASLPESTIFIKCVAMYVNGYHFCVNLHLWEQKTFASILCEKHPWEYCPGSVHTYVRSIHGSIVQTHWIPIECGDQAL